MLSDPIADFIIRLKNAQLVGRRLVLAPYSELKQAIAEALIHAGLIKSAQKKGKKVRKNLEVELIYDAVGAPRIRAVRRISKPSRRVYRPGSQIRAGRHGYGFGFYSTPKGILTDRAAREQKVGGEYLFEIW